MVLAVREFEPRIRLHDDSAEPAWDSFSPPLSLPLPCSLSLCLKISQLKKVIFLNYRHDQKKSKTKQFEEVYELKQGLNCTGSKKHFPSILSLDSHST